MYITSNVDEAVDYIARVLTNKGIKEAESRYYNSLNQENMTLGLNNQPQTAEKDNPIYPAMKKVIESYKAALNDKEETFKQFVIHYEEFKEWLKNKEDK